MWISHLQKRFPRTLNHLHKMKLNFLCSALLLKPRPTFFSLVPINPCKIEKKKIENAILISYWSRSTTLPRNARGIIIRGNSIPSKISPVSPPDSSVSSIYRPQIEKTLVPSSTQLTRKSPKAAQKPLGRPSFSGFGYELVRTLHDGPPYMVVVQRIQRYNSN